MSSLNRRAGDNDPGSRARRHPTIDLAVDPSESIHSSLSTFTAETLPRYAGLDGGLVSQRIVVVMPHNYSLCARKIYPLFPIEPDDSDISLDGLDVPKPIAVGTVGERESVVVPCVQTMNELAEILCCRRRQNVGYLENADVL
ncbi:uncharacterized protein ATNIH1004_001942 [Aspergillus tanneri]|uniref:Uncharacterized protein n=1 Tax=Aspergillus tanneri TaxID=1220188 RepID=A0A5M9MER0_9EURO|nr:uncharacterized protein ATNIH1004_001942 [Aspergillus tanneri]KAA8641477.1 hypothetical protein ATNIH1004_001942 [Aspergillus tanneri]